MEQVSESLYRNLTAIAANSGTAAIKSSDYFVQFSARAGAAPILADIIWKANYNMDENPLHQSTSQGFRLINKGCFRKLYTDISPAANIQTIISEIANLFETIFKRYYKEHEDTFSLDDLFTWHNESNYAMKQLIWGVLKLIIALLVLIMILYECGHFIYMHFK